MENNFKNPTTGEENFIANFQIRHRNGVLIHTDKSGKELTNKENLPLVFITPPPHDFTGVVTLQSNDPKKRTDMLKKRSSEHFKKEISESKYEMNKKLVNDFKAK